MAVQSYQLGLASEQLENRDMMDISQSIDLNLFKKAVESDLCAKEQLQLDQGEDNWKALSR